MTEDEFRATDRRFQAWLAVGAGTLTMQEYRAMGWKPWDYSYQPENDVNQRWLRDDPDGQAHFAAFKVRLAATHSRKMAEAEAGRERYRNATKEAQLAEHARFFEGAINDPVRGILYAARMPGTVLKREYRRLTDPTNDRCYLLEVGGVRGALEAADPAWLAAYHVEWAAKIAGMDDAD